MVGIKLGKLLGTTISFLRPVPGIVIPKSLPISIPIIQLVQ